MRLKFEKQNNTSAFGVHLGATLATPTSVAFAYDETTNAVVPGNMSTCQSK